MNTDTPTIAVINVSDVASDVDAEAWTLAIQKQVSQDLAPHYGDASLLYIPKGGNAPPNTWQIILANDSDQAGALGYHDVTKDGLPTGYAFVGTDLKFGYLPSVTLSHEICEMRGDPYINLTAFDPDGNLRAYETCDAVEADSDGYDIDGVRVSDFVLPAWYDANVPAGTKLDHMGRLTTPFSLRPGGYSSVYHLYMAGTWTQITAQSILLRENFRASHVTPHSRRIRRQQRTARGVWRPSTR
jgi:hypothetical protein